MGSIDDDVDEVATAPDGYENILKSDLAKLDDALRAAADFMYSDLNETRTASLPERLFVNTGAMTVFLAAYEVISEEAALAVLDVMEDSHRQLIKECPTVKERNSLYYQAMFQQEALRLTEERVADYFKVQKTPEKSPLGTQAVVSTGMPATRSGRGITKRGDIVGARHRKRFRSAQRLQTNPRIKAKLKKEMHAHYNALLKQKAKDTVPGLLITVGHCAAIAAGAPVAAAAAGAAALHGIDMWRRGLFDGSSVRGLASGTARGVSTAVTSVGQLVLSERRRRAAPVVLSPENQGMLARAAAAARKGLPGGAAYETAGQAADQFTASEVGRYLRMPIEWAMNNPYTVGAGAVGIGGLVLAHEFGTREAHYEPLRLEHWLGLNDDKDAKRWKKSLVNSASSIEHRQKRGRKKSIADALEGVMNARLTPRLDDAKEIKKIHDFIDRMHNTEDRIRDLLDTTHPAIMPPTYVLGDLVEYDATGFIRPRPPAAGAVAGGAPPALPPPPGPPPGGGGNDDDDGDGGDGDDGGDNPWALPALQAINQVNQAPAPAPAPARRRRRARS